MKKILMMAFVSMALLATSCSKDDDKSSSESRPSLQGTLWEANVQYSGIPVIGSGVVEAQLFFKTDEICRFDVDLPATIQMVLSSLGMGNLDAGEYSYTFDGHKVVMNGSITAELEYTGNTLVYHIPSQYSMVTSYLDASEIVFRKQ